MDEYGSPEEWLEHLGELAEGHGRVGIYTAFYLQLVAEYGVEKEKALEIALEGATPEIREQVINGLDALKDIPQDTEATRSEQEKTDFIAESRRIIEQIGLDDRGSLQSPEEEGESG